MKQAMGYVVGAIIAAGVVALIDEYNRQAAIMLALITLLLVIIANQEATQRIMASIGVKS